MIYNVKGMVVLQYRENNGSLQQLEKQIATMSHSYTNPIQPPLSDEYIVFNNVNELQSDSWSVNLNSCKDVTCGSQDPVLLTFNTNSMQTKESILCIIHQQNSMMMFLSDIQPDIISPKQFLMKHNFVAIDERNPNLTSTQERGVSLVRLFGLVIFRRPRAGR